MGCNAGKEITPNGTMFYSRIKEFNAEKKKDNLTAVEALNLMTCLGFTELERLEKYYKKLCDSQGFRQIQLALFYGINISGTSENLFRAFNYNDAESLEFPTFALVLDSIIGFGYPQLRLEFSKRFFGLHEVETITGKELQDMYEACKMCASNDFVFQPIQFENGGSEHLVTVEVLQSVLERRSELWNFLLPDDGIVALSARDSWVKNEMDLNNVQRRQSLSEAFE